MPSSPDVIIIGAGAAGLMCAIEAGKRGRRVLLLDHARDVGNKIRISGGGRCNFTNRDATPAQYLSDNPRFCVSALARYTPHDFIALVNRHGIRWHEKTLGQLFCDGSAREIIAMLLTEAKDAGVEIQTGVSVSGVGTGTEKRFAVETATGRREADALVMACGGLSIPKMGASGFAYAVAKQFGLRLVDTAAALVPLTFTGALKDRFAGVSGVSVDAEVTCRGTVFREALLHTHRGLSGPAILQISSYWHPGDSITLNVLPDGAIDDALRDAQQSRPRVQGTTVVAEHLPGRLADTVAEDIAVARRVAEIGKKDLQALADRVHAWSITPAGTEGYRTAEVTRGGVDTRDLSSQTLEARQVPGLYFIGEAVDVTGHLGGYNFQWAWASGHAAGHAI